MLPYNFALLPLSDRQQIPGIVPVFEGAMHYLQANRRLSILSTITISSDDSARDGSSNMLSVFDPQPTGQFELVSVLLTRMLNQPAI